MATVPQLVPCLLIALACSTWAQEGTRAPETTVHINPHLPVTIPISNEPEEHTTYRSYLYRGRPISTVHFGGPHPRHPPVRPTPRHPTHHTIHLHTQFPSTPIKSTSHTTEHPRYNFTVHTPQSSTGWVYSGGRWHRVHGGGTAHVSGSSHGDSGSGHHSPHVHHIVHVDSSETNNWNHAIHHELSAGQTQKHYSRLSDKSGGSLPDDSSSSSSSHSGSGQSHGSSGSGESGSSGSGEHSASGSGSE